MAEETETLETQEASRRMTIGNLKADAILLLEGERELEKLCSKVARDAILSHIESARKTVASQIRSATRVLKAVKAGYLQIEKPSEPGRIEGFLEQDPRPYPHTPRWIWPTIGLSGILIFVGWLAIVLLVIYDGPKDLFEQQEELGDVLRWIGIIAAVPVAVALMIIRPWLSRPHTKKNTEALEAAGLPTSAKFFFKTVLPDEAKTAWEDAKASEHFDTIRISAPKRAFQEPNPGSFIIYGIWGNRNTFRIYEFDPQPQEQIAATAS